MIRKEDPLGIPDYGGINYLKMPPGKNSEENTLNEFFGIQNFIKQVLASDAVPEFQYNQRRIEFINYGSTQLVYVLTIDESRQYTLVVNQPATPFGTGKREFENLQSLSKDNKSNVISPLYYFADKNGEKRELYVTPYYYQARCIGVEDKEWGIWVPEPEYLFHDFKPENRKVINSSMVALLVKLYDSKRKMGLSEVRLDGGDFMLEKGFENYDINFENILKRIKLIAARKLETMKFDEYISRIRDELSGKVSEKQEMKVIGKMLRKPLELSEIEAGIKLGLILREREKEKIL